MTLDCDRVRERLAALGDGDGAEDGDASEVARHVAGCAACLAVKRSLDEVDVGLASLGALEPPSALVERTLRSLDALPLDQGSHGAPGRVGLLAILGIVLGGVRRGLGAILLLLVAPFTAVRGALRAARAPASAGGGRWAPLAGVVAVAGAVALVALGGTVAMLPRMSSRPEEASLDAAEWLSDGHDARGRRGEQAPARPPVVAARVEHRSSEAQGDLAQRLDRQANEVASPRPTAQAGPTPADALVGWDDDGFRQAQLELGGQGGGGRDRVRRVVGEDDGRLTLPPRDDWSLVDESRAPETRRFFGIEGNVDLPADHGAFASVTERERARNPFADRGRFEGLTLKEPRGYWANTYVPGDPALRTAYARLVLARGPRLGPDGQSGLALAERVTTTSQPFDAPARAALGLYVHADRAATEGAGRVLLQVGLRAAARAPGQRPALGVVILLDLRQPPTTEGWARVQALLEAASRAREPDDRFGVVAAGPSGGTVIAQGTLRHGEIAVAMQRLRAGTAPEPGRGALGLEEALRSAMASLATPEASTSPSGTGLVWLVTPGLGSVDAGLERVAHVGAVAGIATSVLTIGDAGDPAALESVVLAGQGRRRTVGAAAEAERVVRSELDAGGQVVARAVRLRIRLAPGVQLVDVLGSRRLDDAAAARVREAERAADVQLARELGITSDRGEDEDGIQLVVPTFYAGDTHVILLDLVVAGPGPVAEVTARYKDLVRLRNATANGSLSLARGTRPRGSLERNVVANLVARELASVLERAGERAAAGAIGEAAALLRAFAANVRSLDATYPELARDARIAADVELALGFATVLDTPSSQGAAPVVADSLIYASYRRLLRPALAQSP